MTHLHIPDGSLPVGVASAGWAVAAVALAVSLWMLRARDARRNLALTGVTGALMLAAMSVPLGPLPVHLNLAVLAGVLLGPAMSVLCAFSVNVVLALVGHGGVTAVGLNTVLLAVQAAGGGAVFSLLRKRVAPATAAALSTAVAVTVSLGIGAWILGIGGSPATQAYSRGLAAGAAGRLWRIGVVAAPIALVGLVCESVAVGAAVALLDRVRPDLVGGSRGD
ncbi:MAG: energy-coupling factor ABC transporter permease [Firmicutes bacterium]|jgi:cobalt/nickel transport system permease protein|nr:energy-coupling factor ABC transporter permease [Bacillota bacterium]